MLNEWVSLPRDKKLCLLIIRQKVDVLRVGSLEQKLKTEIRTEDGRKRERETLKFQMFIFQDGDEVESLKKEIEKYRLELKNREINFNRVFAEKTPMIIKKPETQSEDMVST